MPSQRLVALLCKISRGGFTQERVFRVEPSTGEAYIGTAPLHYCYTANNRLLDSEQPPAGKQLLGKVAARLIKEEDGMALVSLPDGHVLIVPKDQYQEWPRGVEPHVPVQS